LTPHHGPDISGTDCESCHGHHNGYEYSPGSGSFQSHSTHTESDIDDLKGPHLSCDTCHDTNNFPNFISGTDANEDGYFSLAETDVCNNCHSPDGVMNGVDSTNGSVGAKDSWSTGVYAGAILAAGKERWCDGCHDDAPANSKADNTGVSARNPLGDNVTYGYYQTGHGTNGTVDCLQCHSSLMPHIDHIYTPILDVMKTTQNPTNYRFYVGKGMQMPYDGTDAPENFELCFSCHDQADLYKESGLVVDATTNFRTDTQNYNAEYANRHSYHSSYANCVFCHDPHGTSAPRMTVDERIGNFRLITLNSNDNRYYELTDPALWNSVADNNGGASTGPAACSTCHSSYLTTLKTTGAVEPTSAMYQRLYLPLTFEVTTDSDNDGVLDVNDNCVAIANPAQSDTDADNVGDDCDLCVGTYSPDNRDRDRDGMGDACDSCFDDPDNDIDGDGICAGSGFLDPKTGDNDNCPSNPNPGQEDTDSDGFADACDNCPDNSNADQADLDLDGIGDVCDTSCDTFLNAWSSKYNSTTARVNSGAIDGDENLYGAGYTSAAFPGYTNQGGISDLAIIKYDKNGNFQTATQFGSSDDSWEDLYGIAVDTTNNFVYVTGYTKGSLPGFTLQGPSDTVFAKFDTDLNTIWVKQIGTLSNDYGHSIAVDASGDVYVGGETGSYSFPACTFKKYDSDGNELWSTSWSSSCQRITSVVVDGTDIYVGGQFNDDAFVKQFNSDGVSGWFAQAGTSGVEKDISIAVTDSNIYVLGATSGYFPGFTNMGTDDLFTLKLDKLDGTHLATNQIGGSGRQYSGGIVATPTGSKIYAAGSTMYDFFLPSAGQFDSYLLSFDTDLNVLRRKQPQGEGLNNRIVDLEISPLDDGIYTMGNHNNNFIQFLKEAECSGSDVDGDGLDDAIDNCPLIFNADQTNADNDALGDVCDPCPNDPSSVCNNVGVCDSNNVTFCVTDGECTAAGGFWWSDNTCLGVPESETVTSSGRVWMDRNLGASQVATSSTDSAAYGDLYQWGRGADGHQLRTSATTSTLSSTDDPGHGDFILMAGSPWDWRVPQNDNLWQDVSGTNNPCPAGFRLPTEIEWETERASWSSNNSAGAFASPLKLVEAGYRNPSSGTVASATNAFSTYWSSTVLQYNSRGLYFHSSFAYMRNDIRTYGFSVRCLTVK